MPELPDVEGFRRLLDRYATGQGMSRVEVPDPSVLRNATPSSFRRALVGRRIRVPHRHGKWLLAPTDGPTILFHFGMTGALVWASHGEKRHPHDRVVLVLERGGLRFRDQRKLQGIWLARDDDETDRILGCQGPDAYGLSRAELEGVLAGRRGSLKARLMDQRVVAGLGNLLADEIIWRARLHPSQRVERLDQGQVGRLHRALGSVLEASVKAGRVPPRHSWLTGVRDDEAPACPRCGTGLRRSRTGGRRSWWCPSCQPVPR